jgi:hypothetical protein
VGICREHFLQDIPRALKIKNLSLLLQVKVKVKVKISLLQAVEAHRVAGGQGSNG